VTLPNQIFNVGTGNSGIVVTQTAGAAFTITRLTALDQFTNIATGTLAAKPLLTPAPAAARLTLRP